MCDSLLWYNVCCSALHCAVLLCDLLCCTVAQIRVTDDGWYEDTQSFRGSEGVLAFTVTQTIPAGTTWWACCVELHCAVPALISPAMCYYVLFCDVLCCSAM